jgi:hypothetical protein
MPTSKKRGGKKAHNKRVKQRNEKIAKDQQWAEDFMKNYQVNDQMLKEIQIAKKNNDQAYKEELAKRIVAPQNGTKLTLTGGDNE